MSITRAVCKYPVKRAAIVLAGMIAGLSGVAHAADEARFYPALNLSKNTGLSFNPSIAIDGNGNAVVAWNDNSFGNMEVMVSRSTDHGKSWGAPLNVSNNAGLSTFPVVEASPDGTMHMVYQDGDGGQSAIYYSKSTDQGQSFSTPVKISSDGVVAVNPVIIADSQGSLFVTYSTSDKLYIARSTNGGNSFSVQGNLKVKSYAASAIAIGTADSVHLTWSDGGEVYYAVSTQSGRSFSRPLNLSNSTTSSKAPSLSTDTLGNVYVSWSEELNKDNTEIYLSKSNNNGSRFGRPMNVSANDGFSIEPDIHVDSRGNVHLAWQDTTPGNYEAVYAYSSNRGTSFSPTQNIAPSEFGSLITKIKTDKDGTIFIAWDDNRDGDFEATVVTGRFDIAAITATVTPETFTPDGDGVDDQTLVSASFTETLNWTLAISDTLGQSVITRNGQGAAFDETWDGRDSNGTSAAPGLYQYSITGVDVDGYDAVPKQGVIEIKSAVQPTQPEISFFDASPFLDPDGDGRRDSAIFEGTFNQSLDWTLELVDADRNVLWSASGKGISFNLTWTGIGNNGNMTADGAYSLELKATDDRGNSVTDSKPVTVDSVDPQWSNLVLTESFSPNGDGANDVASIDFDISEGALVTVYVFEASSGSLVRELFRNSFSAPSHVSVSWDGLNGGGQAVAKGTYEYSIWIRDFAANRANPYPIRKTVTVE